MSRIGNKAISIPDGVTVTIADKSAEVVGAKGSLTVTIPKGILVKVEDGQVRVSRKNDDRQTRAYHGLVRSLLNNQIIGVSQGYSKKLELVGTGYRVKKQGNELKINVGHSHPDTYVAPEGIEFVTESDTLIAINGIDKQLVGEVAAKIRSLRPPEPYKGKGIRYQGEVIRRKAGKAAKSAA